MIDLSNVKQAGMNETLDKLCQLIASHEWWIFIFATAGRGGFVMKEVKEKYYHKGTPLEDWGIMMSPTVTFVQARKSRMTKDQLAEIMANFTRPEDQVSPARIQETKEELESLKRIFLESKEDRDVIPITTDEGPELNDIVLTINHRLRLHWDALRED